MGKTLREIAQDLKDANKKVQLIYAFNGTGKTRLSREFKSLVEPLKDEDIEETEMIDKQFLYYNAFTEDLFYWDNDLKNDSEPKLKVHPNLFTSWILKEQGQGNRIAEKFKTYTNTALEPKLSFDYNEITFSVQRGNDEVLPNVKISKGEESNYIWSLFFVLLEDYIEIIDESDSNESKYIFIDDPVTSLDDNHLINLAVDLATLIKKSNELDIYFIITTHNPLFYNVLFNEFRNNNKEYKYKSKTFRKYLLEKLEDGTFNLDSEINDSPFSYHLFLLNEIEDAIKTGELRKYHFNFIRNILEKTATFLGYSKLLDLLPKTSEGQHDPYVNRVINLSSHSKHSGEEISKLSNGEKKAVIEIFNHLISSYKFNKGEINDRL